MNFQSQLFDLKISKTKKYIKSIVLLLKSEFTNNKMIFLAMWQPKKKQNKISRKVPLCRRQDSPARFQEAGSLSRSPHRGLSWHDVRVNWFSWIYKINAVHLRGRSLSNSLNPAIDGASV